MGIEHWLREQYTQPGALAGFDSSTTMVRALSRSLRGEGFPGLGIFPPQVDGLLPRFNYLPKRVRAGLYRQSTANEAIDPEQLSGVDIESIRAWVTDRYPKRGYPAVLVGSASGALVYLAALLGIPWLPQTFLIPVRRDVDPDDPRADLANTRQAGARLLAANPDIAIHQMNDPNQDRRPLPKMAYFRVKLLELGPAYREFIETVLDPTGTLIVSDCTLEWPSTTVQDQHYFQFGCIGGFEPDDYYDGSDAVRRFLREQESDRRQWDPPEPDGERAEAEWGLNDALVDDLRSYAADRGYDVHRLAFDHPGDLGPVVADAYRSTYAERGLPTDRILATTFSQIDPWWALRTGSIPLWLSFTAETDADRLDAYLDAQPEPVAELYLSLFSHGVDSWGLATPDRWRQSLSRSTDTGAFLGTDPSAYPFDFSSYVKYHSDIPRRISERVPLVAPIGGERLAEWVSGHSSVRFEGA